MDLRDLLRYALLAPSSHNSQPWLFHLSDGRIDLHADLSRWLRVADNDQRELYLSLGCALENLLVAAEQFGYEHDVRLLPDPGLPEWAASIALREGGSPSAHRPPELFEALPRRHTNHRPYTGEPVSYDTLGRLAGVVVEEGVRLVTTRDSEVIHEVEKLVAQADRTQLADPAYRQELGKWIASGALGGPWGLRWVAGAAVGHLDLSRPAARMEAALMESAGALALVVATDDDPSAQLRAGQALERVWLMATHLEIAAQPMSGPIEVPSLRRELGRVLGEGSGFAQHLFRLGHAKPERARRPRRALEEVSDGS